MAGYRQIAKQILKTANHVPLQEAVGSAVGSERFRERQEARGTLRAPSRPSVNSIRNSCALKWKPLRVWRHPPRFLPCGRIRPSGSKMRVFSVSARYGAITSREHLGAQCRIAQVEHHFDALVNISLHPVGAAQIYFRLPAVSEYKNAAVLQKSSRPRCARESGC